MATPPTSSSTSSNSGGPSTSGATSSSKKDKSKSVSVKIQPTIGPSFSLSLPASTRISSLKESISDKMGLSPQKMTLLLHSNELETGTLTSNSIEEGTEIRLVPAVESGVTTVNSVDPVAMMKHSMSGISDQQIDDFLNGKSPLSVAIRVGESVVVVNLHRAKVEEIEVDPPPTKRRCVRSRHPSSDEADSPLSSPRSHHHHHTHHSHHHHHLSSRTSEGLRHLNSNNSSDEVMDTLESLLPSSSSSSSSSCFSSSTTTSSTSSSSRRRSTARLQECSSLRTVKDKTHSANAATAVTTTPSSSLERSTSSAHTGNPSRKRLLPSVGGCTSNAVSLVQCLKDTSHRKSASGSSSSRSNSNSSSNSERTGGGGGRAKMSSIEEASSSYSSRLDRSPLPSPTSSLASSPSSSKPPSPRRIFEENKLPVSPSSPGSPASSISSTSSSSSTTTTKTTKTKSVSRSVQTDPEPRPSERREHSSSSSSSSSSDHHRESSGRRFMNRREIKLPENGVSMKRKAVMEAISEILKKMYASSDKGRLPGSFKGRFSSEFTCDSDMQEILHSKTTMTSYGSEIEDPDRKGSGSDMDASNSPENAALISKAKFEENEQLKGKVAQLKWRMQQHRALRKAKRKGEKSACGWLEALNCDMPLHPPKERDPTGFCGLKRGFLLAD